MSISNQTDGGSGAEEVQFNRNKILLDENFYLPQYEDYFINDIPQDLIENIRKDLQNDSSIDPSFYIEEPAKMEPGYYDSDRIFVLGAKPLLEGIYDNLNYFDGDTAMFSMESVTNIEPFILNGTLYKNFSEYIKKSASNSDINKGRFTVRLLGIDAPEIPHYTVIPCNKEDIEYINGKELKGAVSSNIIYEKNKERIDSEKYSFVRINKNNPNSKLCEAVPYSYTYVTDEDVHYNTLMKVLTKDDSEKNSDYAKQGLECKSIMKDLLSRAKDIRIMLDAKTCNPTAGDFPKSYGEDYIGSNYNIHTSLYKDIYDRYEEYVGETGPQNNGYNFFGQDAYRRYLGAIFVKVRIDSIGGEAWINLGKYLIANCSKVELKNDPNSIDVSNAFNLNSYDKNKVYIADSFNTIVSSNKDDRAIVQSKIFKSSDFESLKKDKVMIGDTMFFVPPNCIRVVTATETERVPLIRSKGSMAKGGTKIERLIELKLYFNNDNGINGYKYDTELPSGENVSYYINGLRSIIAQFKCTPFLPVENDYLNSTMSIDAVTLNSIQFSTMPNYPRCYAATIIMEEFDYTAYMPEIPVDDVTKNFFSKTIDYKLMRYYYQRSILNGEKIKDLNFNSKEYIYETIGSKTALQPMRFKDSSVEFYVPDKNYLDYLLKLKESASNNPTAPIAKLNESQFKFIQNLAKIYDGIQGYKNSAVFKDASKLISDKNCGELYYYNGGIKTGYKQDDKLGKLYIIKSTGETFTDNSDRAKKSYDKFYYDIISGFYNIIDFNKGRAINRIYMTTRTVKPESGAIASIAVDYHLAIDNNNMSNLEINTIINNIASRSGIPIKNFYDKNKNEFIITLYTDFVASDDGTCEIVTDFKVYDSNASSPFYAGYSALQTCNAISMSTNIADDEDWVLNDNKTLEDQLTEDKASIDISKYSSIPFVKYNADECLVTSISCSYANNLTKIYLNNSDTYSPQYCGGQDVIIDMVIQTKDKVTASLIDNLPKHAANITREYRKILSVWPIRINSEFTRFCGVNEVLIENVNVNTCENFPNLYEINVRLVSVDRTVRNRESLTKIETENNSGATNNNQGEKIIKGYFDIESTIAKAELYPDLELPTLEELSKDGFKILRYNTGKSNRVYPDPDFYFVYAHILTSQIYRNAITHFFNDNVKDKDFKYNLIDKTGATTSIVADSENGYSENEKDRNTIYVTQSENLSNIAEAKEEMASSKNKENENKVCGDISNSLLEDAYLLGMFNSWDISNKIKCAFNIPTEENKYDDKIREKTELLIDKINDVLSGPVESYKGSFKKLKYRSSYGHKFFGGVIKNNTVSILEHKFKDVFEEIIGQKLTTKHMKFIGDIMTSMCFAKTANAEYDDKADKSKWKSSQFRHVGKYAVPYCKTLIDGVSDSYSYCDDIDNMLDNGMEFGPFLVKLQNYSKINLYDEKYIKKDGYYFIDPYYRNASEDEIKEYKIGLLYSPPFAVEAQIRLVLYGILTLLKKNIYITKQDVALKEVMDKIDNEIYKINAVLDGEYYSNNEVQSQGPLTQSEAKIFYEEYSKSNSLFDAEEYSDIDNPVAMEKGDENRDNDKTDYIDKIKLILEQLKALKKILEESKFAYAIGKVFAPALLSICNGKTFYSLYLAQDYDKLNAITCNTTIPVGSEDKDVDDMRLFRKLCLSLVGLKTIKASQLSMKGNNAGNAIATQMAQRIFLKAANDPIKYITHSFYDMVANDKRGRMARAFPTFYILFMDEGRKIGYWKLHDNFYNMSAISSINIVKSRKIAADTATVVMSNLYKSYTTEDEDIEMTNDYNLKDAFNSIFSPRTYWEKEELRRINEPSIEKARITPGTRIHIRMGYDSDASRLPIVFNGNIAEISAGEFVSIVAQGDGIELSNPLLEKMSAEDVQYDESVIGAEQVKSWWQKGDTPRNILATLLTHKGGFIKKFVSSFTDGRFYNYNEYGLMHFGESDYKEIWNEGEPVQNIYEATSDPSFGYSKANKLSQVYGMQDAPKISMPLESKTFWDVMHICKSVSPDFIVGIAPFGMRSTIFHGHPRYYYAYEYQKAMGGSSNSFVIEKRKPYQQYHIYTSETDIIANCIKASEKNMKTCAVGIYQGVKVGKGTKVYKTEPLFVDWNIYPEKQKTMTVDTQLVSKGTKHIDGIDWAIDKFSRKIGSETSKNSSPAYATAWRMTASALNDSVKDMYEGELIVLGDPTVKPHDLMYIIDNYERMTGKCGVEAVVHNFDASNGYTTSIYADCISCVDDKHALIAENMIKEITMSSAVMTTVMAVGGIRGAKKNSIPLIRAASKHLDSKYLDMIPNIIGKENWNIASKVDKIRDVTTFPLGYNSNMRKADKFASAFSDSVLRLKDIASIDIDDTESLLKALNKLQSGANGLSSSEVMDMLNGISGEADDVKSIINALNGNASSLESILKSNFKFGSGSGEINTKLINEALNKINDKEAKELLKAMDMLGDGASSLDDIATISKAIKKAGSHLDDKSIFDAVANATKASAKTLSEGAEALSKAGIQGKVVAAISKYLGVSAGAAAITFAGISIAIDMAISFIVTQSTSELIERWLENLRVLQIFPLKKDNKAYVAGLDGSYGLVYGHPSYTNTEGSIQDFLFKVFNNKLDDTFLNISSHVFNFLFTTDRMREIVNGYQREEGLPDINSSDMNDNMTSNAIEDIMKAVASNDMANISSYHANMLTPKVEDVNTTEGKNALITYAITNSDIESNKVITKELCLISKQNKIESMLEKGTVVLANDIIANENPEETKQIAFVINNTEQNVNCIVKNGVYDIPFLRAEAVYILLRLVEVYETKVKDLNKNPIVIQSCLKPGEKNSKGNPTWNTTGFVFKISFQGYEKGEDLLNEILNDEAAILTKHNMPGNSFMYKKTNSDTFNILVYPPKI